MADKIEPQIRCTCCGGSGKYNPLTGPAEPCGTCKGEGVIPNPALDQGVHRTIDVKFKPETQFEKDQYYAGQAIAQGMDPAEAMRRISPPSDVVPKMIFESTPNGDQAERMRALYEMNIGAGSVETLRALTAAQHREVHEFPNRVVNVPLKDFYAAELGQAWTNDEGRVFPKSMLDAVTRRDNARQTLTDAAIAAHRTDLSQVEQFETLRNLVAAKRDYMNVKTQTFVELYGGTVKSSVQVPPGLVYRQGRGWVPADAPDVRTMSPEEYMKARQNQSFMQTYRDKYQAESRIHRKGYQSGDISIKFSVPPELKESMEKVEAAFKTLTRTLMGLGCKIEVGCASIGKAMRNIDPGVAGFDAYINGSTISDPFAGYAKSDVEATQRLSKLWAHQRDAVKGALDELVVPRYQVDPIADVQYFDESSLILPVFHKDDPVLARIKQVQDDLVLRAAQRSNGPLFYDPESGAISPCESGPHINSQYLRRRNSQETSSSEPSPGQERLP
jgi:hypothetical protein